MAIRKETVSVPGPTIECPICHTGLARSRDGVISHTRMHVRKGEMAQEDANEIILFHWPIRFGKGSGKL